jgi:DNA-binding GntR family transcriptional regulator
MQTLAPQQSLVDQVYEAILAEITSGRLGTDARLIQEDLAQSLGVSRQPVQQALLLLRAQGLVVDAPGRGLMVAPLEPAHVRNLYEIRAVLDGLATAKSAERGRDIAAREGPGYIARGREAVRSRDIARMIAADMEFHFLLYRLSGNPLVAEVSGAHWSTLRRAMGEVLLRGDLATDIWDQHEAILEAVSAGDAGRAEVLAREHISHASEVLARGLASSAAAAPAPARRTRRAASA